MINLAISEKAGALTGGSFTLSPAVNPTQAAPAAFYGSSFGNTLNAPQGQAAEVVPAPFMGAVRFPINLLAQASLKRPGRPHHPERAKELDEYERASIPEGYYTQEQFDDLLESGGWERDPDVKPTILNAHLAYIRRPRSWMKAEMEAAMLDCDECDGEFSEDDPLSITVIDHEKRTFHHYHDLCFQNWLADKRDFG